MGLFNLSNDLPFHDVNNHRSRKRRKYHRMPIAIWSRTRMSSWLTNFSADINFNRIINDFNASYIDMNGRRKPVALADRVPRSRERKTRIFLAVLFFALTWPTCSVRYARRVIYRNPSTTAIQPARCNGSETTGYKSRRELGSSERALTRYRRSRNPKCLVTILF